MKSKKDIIEKYYRDNPDQQVRHLKSMALELGAGPALGALVGASRYKGIKPTVGAALGFGLSLPTYAVREAHRRKKILKQMGVDQSVLSSFMEPIKRVI